MTVLRQLAGPLALGAAASCGSAASVLPAPTEVSGTFESAWVQLPELPTIGYAPLNIPRGRVTLPALIVGEDGQLSAGCFESLQPAQPNPVLEELRETVLRETDISGEMKVSFEKALVDAGLDVSAASLLTQRAEVSYKGMQIVEVDPANVRADFDNEACTAVDGEWFVNDRTVVTGAIRVDSLSVEMGSLADTDQRAAVAAAVAKLNTSLDASFTRSVLGGDSVRYTGADIFIGVVRTRLGARRCSGSVNTPLMVGQRARFTGCDGKVRVMMELSSPTEPYTVNILMPDDGVMTGPITIARNTGFRTPVGSLRLATGLLETDLLSGGFEQAALEVSILQVLPLGARN